MYLKNIIVLTFLHFQSITSCMVLIHYVYFPVVTKWHAFSVESACAGCVVRQFLDTTTSARIKLDVPCSPAYCLTLLNDLITRGIVQFTKLVPLNFQFSPIFFYTLLTTLVSWFGGVEYRIYVNDSFLCWQFIPEHAYFTDWCWRDTRTRNNICTWIWGQNILDYFPRIHTSPYFQIIYFTGCQVVLHPPPSPIRSPSFDIFIRLTIEVYGQPPKQLVINSWNIRGCYWRSWFTLLAFSGSCDGERSLDGWTDGTDHEMSTM